VVRHAYGTERCCEHISIATLTIHILSNTVTVASVQPRDVPAARTVRLRVRQPSAVRGSVSAAANQTVVTREQTAAEHRRRAVLSYV
jgi:hypothetical protein